MLLFARPYKVGDKIRVSGTEGFVNEIGLLHTWLGAWLALTRYLPLIAFLISNNQKLIDYLWFFSRRYLDLPNRLCNGHPTNAYPTCMSILNAHLGSSFAPRQSLPVLITNGREEERHCPGVTLTPHRGSEFWSPTGGGACVSHCFPKTPPPHLSSSPTIGCYVH